MSKSNNSKVGGRKRTVLNFLFLLAIIVGISGGALYWYYFIPNGSVVPAFNESNTTLIVNGEIDLSKNQPKVIEGDILFPYSTVKKYFDSNIYWDEALKKLTITSENKVIRMKTDSLEAMINNKPVTLKIPVTLEGDTPYLSLDFLKELYNIEISYLKYNNVIIVDHTNKSFPLVKVINEKGVIRRDKTIRAPIIKKILSEDEKTLRVFDESEKWLKVRSKDGEVGYIEKRFAQPEGTTQIKEYKDKEVTPAWKPKSGKINLTWEMTYGKRNDLAKLPKIDGLDVFSPTWFEVVDDKGTIVSKADPKYVEWLKQNNYKVWPLLANNFENPDMTKKLLNNTDVRDNMIRQMLSYAALYKLDGINFDFENIYKGDKDAYTQFIREAAPLLREQGLVVSVDVSIPDGSDNWSLCYDRKALAEAVDYLMLMTYDQHWSGSPKAGSIAQISWVESNLKKVLGYVPKEKLVLGVPFYTRIWKEELGEGGKSKVTSQVASMDVAKKTLKDNNANILWDESSGQFYGEYKKDGATYKVWLEDNNSINLKSSLVHKYNLAGVASWSKNDVSQDIWAILNKNMKQYNSYEAWAIDNKEKKYVFN